MEARGVGRVVGLGGPVDDLAVGGEVFADGGEDALGCDGAKEDACEGAFEVLGCGGIGEAGGLCMEIGDLEASSAFLEEGGAFVVGFEQEPLEVRSCDREWDGGEADASADVEELCLGWEVVDVGEGKEGVDDMAIEEFLCFAGTGQADLFVPLCDEVEVGTQTLDELRLRLERRLEGEGLIDEGERVMDDLLHGGAFLVWVRRVLEGSFLVWLTSIVF